jgi:glycosyltransferase involved in cell wall biosynthesis
MLGATTHPTLTGVTTPVLISAIMPAYNAAATIRDAIQSVRWQTESRWELIVVDDGSTDGTADVANAAAGGDSRVRVVRQHHAGRGVARNTCLKEVAGGIVAICDADDMSLPDRFATALAAFDTDPRIGVVASCRLLAIGDDPPWQGVITAPCTNSGVHAAFNRHRMPILFASSMIRTSLIARGGGFDPELRRNQDYGLLLRIHAETEFRLLPDPMIIYRTMGVIGSRRLVFESNFFRHYATRRAAGLTLSSDEFARSWPGRAYRWLAIPLMYAWFVAKRAVLRLDAPAITEAERLVIDDARRRLAFATSSQPAAAADPRTTSS